MTRKIPFGIMLVKMGLIVMIKVMTMIMVRIMNNDANNDDVDDECVGDERKDESYESLFL